MNNFFLEKSGRKKWRNFETFLTFFKKSLDVFEKSLGGIRPRLPRWHRLRRLRRLLGGGRLVWPARSVLDFLWFRMFTRCHLASFEEDGDVDNNDDDNNDGTFLIFCFLFASLSTKK